jgi:Ni/Co efflux regulator RcnB
MRKLLISAATLALLAIPALAQPEPPGSRGKAMMGHQQPTPAPQAAPAGPQAAPAAPQNRGGDRGGRGGDRGARGPLAPVAQPAGPVAQPGNRFDGNRDGRGNYGRNDRNDNRSGWRGNDNRPGYNSFGNQRRDYSNFRDYHRGFNAERRFRGPSYRRPQGWYARRWSFGDILPGLFWGQQYWLNNYVAYDLPSPPPGTVWVRNGDDALLIDRYTGEVISIRYSVFY